MSTSKEILAEVILCYNYNWKQHPNYQGDSKCDICLDDTMVGSYVLETGCGHKYHQSCVISTLVDFKFMSCPTCMKPYTKKDQNSHTKKID